MTDEQTPPDVIEGQAKPVTAAELEPAVMHAPAPTTQIVQAAPALPTREVLRPLDGAAVVEGMKAYQALLPELLDSSDYQGTGDDAFVKKSGWRKIARAFNLTVTIVATTVERDADGSPLRAECIARATAPNGQSQDADGYCAITEFTGKRASDPKLENTLRATATTRAKNRAIADLVGMGEVSAEEMEVANTGTADPAANDDETKQAKKALIRLCGGDAKLAGEAWKSALQMIGRDAMPRSAAAAIFAAAEVLRVAQAAEAPDDPKPQDEAEAPDTADDTPSPADDDDLPWEGTDGDG